MFDLIIEGGTIVNGSGGPAFSGDVAITDGRVVEMGRLGSTSARRRIDAGGLVVAPGFIDVHTHLDAQLLWDPWATPSIFHGVTTFIGGNCGYSLAPIVESQTAFMSRLLAKVEGMPLEALEKGVDFAWATFGEYLARLDGDLAVNAGIMVGHSALRRAVLGDRASEAAAATEDDLRLMEAVLGRSLQEGGLGFSSSGSPGHFDGEGCPVPSRFAEPEEFLRLAAVTGQHGGTSLEYIPWERGEPDPHQVELMSKMSSIARRSLNWNLLQVDIENPDVTRKQVAVSDHASAVDGHVVALMYPGPTTLRMNFITGRIFDLFPDWRPIVTLPLPEKARALRDPGTRGLLRRNLSEWKGHQRLINWSLYTVDETFSAANAGYSGRTIGDIARQRGADELDTLLDIALADDLRTVFFPEALGADDASWAFRGELAADDRVVIGGSDVGAHVDMLATFAGPTSLLGEAVRKRGLLTVEQAVQAYTSVPAALYGLHERGRIAGGYCADLVLFDADAIAPGSVGTRLDLPGGALRLYGQPEGVEYVLVNGATVVERGDLTDARPGTVLRSGRDTATTSK